MLVKEEKCRDLKPWKGILGGIERFLEQCTRVFVRRWKFTVVAHKGLEFV